MALLADDVDDQQPDDGHNDRQGGRRGRHAQPAGRRRRGGITWRDPVADGDNVKIVGDGSPFGAVRILISFTGEDKILEGRYRPRLLADESAKC